MNKAELIKALGALGVNGVEEVNIPELEALLARVEKDAAEISSLKKVIENLNKTQPKSASASKFKVGGKTFKLVAKTSNYKGKIITAEVLKGNADLLKELVKIKAGILKEV
jgi:hypothetical protein